MGGHRELVEHFITSLEARDWEAWAALLDPDVVYEIPQSRERIRGRDRYLQFNQEYPATGTCGPRSSSPTSTTGWCGSSGTSVTVLAMGQTMGWRSSSSPMV
jgi:ketosteroid isomerase-like protein